MSEEPLDELEDAPPFGKQVLRIVRDGLLLVLAFLLLLPVVGWLRSPSLPEQAPDFELPALDGGTVALADLQGQTVVLNFWATWCGPCRVEIPSFSRFADNNPDIAVLGVATDGSRAQLAAAKEKLDIRYRILRADSATIQAYGAHTIPMTVVVGPDGEVRGSHTGVMFRPHLWWLTR